MGVDVQYRVVDCIVFPLIRLLATWCTFLEWNLGSEIACLRLFCSPLKRILHLVSFECYQLNFVLIFLPSPSLIIV